MRVARVENGTVANIEVWPDGAELPPACREVGALVDIGWTFDGSTFTPPDEPASIVVLSPLQFLSRLTPQELAGISAAAAANPMVDVWRMMMLAAAEIRSDDPRTQEGLAFAVQMGLLTAERAQAVMA